MAIFRFFVSATLISILAIAIGCSSSKNPAAPVIPPTNLNLDYYDYLDLDSDSVETVNMPGSPPQSNGMDFWIAYNGNTTIHGRVFQRSGREIAHLVGRSFASVTAADADTATYSTSVIDQPFGTDRTILFKTEMGAVYKLGNPVETSSSVDGVTFDYLKLKDGP